MKTTPFSQFLKSRGLTQRQVAKAAGMDETQISHAKNDDIRLSTASRIYAAIVSLTGDENINLFEVFHGAKPRRGN